MSNFGLQVFRSDGSPSLDLSGKVGRVLWSGMSATSGSVNVAPYQGTNPNAPYFASGISFPPYHHDVQPQGAFGGGDHYFYQGQMNGTLTWSGNVVSWYIVGYPVLIIIMGWN